MSDKTDMLINKEFVCKIFWEESLKCENHITHQVEQNSACE